jgi:hypothetical protein
VDLDGSWLCAFWYKDEVEYREASLYELSI